VPQGLQLLEARYYDPEVGRFLSPDPIGFLDGLNLYAYCGNNPVGFVDPLGLWATGSYTGDVMQVFRGYADVALSLAKMASPMGQWESLMGGVQLGLFAAQCGVGTAFNLVAQGIISEYTDWLTTDDPRRFGQSFGNVLTTVAMQRLPAGVARACFPAGTEILTEEGPKPIEEIREGDRVLSADPETGEQSYRRVLDAFSRQADELLRIVTADGRSIEATPEHPFWVETKGFVEAGRLARSDLLRDVAGRSVAVVAVVRRPGRVVVYNFEVETTHTYYAGGWWVHNACKPPVKAWEVGTYRELAARSVRGDALSIHHLPQRHPAGQVISGYSWRDGLSIAVPEGKHVKIPNLTGEFTGSARDLFAKGLRDLRRAGAPREAVREVRDRMRSMYPEAYRK
jgi:hypothetical protein